MPRHPASLIDQPKVLLVSCSARHYCRCASHRIHHSICAMSVCSALISWQLTDELFANLRHRDWLGDLHGSDKNRSSGSTQLQHDNRTNRTTRVRGLSRCHYSDEFYSICVAILQVMFESTNSYTILPMLGRILCSLSEFTGHSTCAHLSFPVASTIVQAISPTGSYCCYLWASDCTRSLHCAFLTIAGLWRLCRWQSSHSKMGFMIRELSCSGQWYQIRCWKHGGQSFHNSAALSVKMSVLLYLPGLLVILFKRRGLFSTLIHLVTLSATQVLFAAPFLREDPWGYARSAFDLGRVFLYKWTVNWRLLDEETFLSNRFAMTLLVGHGTVLIAFGLFKWCAPDGGAAKILYRGLRRPFYPPGLVPVTADCEYLNSASPTSFPLIWYYTVDVATVLFTSNLIGIIFARSLHYQFYSWYTQQLPFLAWRTCYPWPLKWAFDILRCSLFDIYLID